MISGIVEASRILVASGAKNFSTIRYDSLAVGSGNVLTASDLDRFEDGVRRRGIVANKVGLFSAHIMGSVRMGNEKISFWDDSAESYELVGLFIGGASAHPTSLRVNPMITMMSMSLQNAIKIDGILRL